MSYAEGMTLRLHPLVCVLCLGSAIAACNDGTKSDAPSDPTANGRRPPIVNEPPPSTLASAVTIPSTSAMTLVPPPAERPPMSVMQAASNKLTIDSWNAHDAKAIATAYTRDAVVSVPGMPDVKGRDGIADDAQAMLKAFPDLKLAYARVWKKGSIEVVEWVMTGTNKGAFHGKAATSRPMGVRGASVLEFTEDGLVQSERRYFDVPTMTSQIAPNAQAGSFRPVASMPIGSDVQAATDDAASLAKVNAVYAAIDSHKTDAMLALFPDDTTFDDVSQPSAYKGKKGLGEMASGLFAAFPDLKQKNTLQLTADGVVLSEGVLTGTHKGPLGPMKATNKPVAVHYLDVWRIDAGKVTGGTTYSNGFELLVEIGAATPPAASSSAK